MRKVKVVGLSVVLTLCASQVCAERILTYRDLVDRLWDMEYVATLPARGETCKQWSSYDRRSFYDEETGKYVNWEANGDGFGGTGWIRREDGKLVLAEMEGPGCIWRIWSATPREGHMRIYLDGEAEPAVDLPFIGYFDGKNEPFTRPALVHIVASGKNCYVPIPFQKSCKIVADKDYGEFHHFTYTLFPKETVVPTFSREFTAEEAAVLDRANEILSHCGPGLQQYDQQSMETVSVQVEPRSKATVLDMEGPRAISSFVVRPRLPQDIEERRAVLRELVLQVSWDDESRPAIWCPLGDFFGTAPGVNHYRSLPLGMTEKGFYSNWYMPFERRAHIEIVNDGSEARSIEFSITHAPLARPIDQLARLHVKWHRDTFLPEEPERRIDWTMLKTGGRGRFCGVELQVWNPRGGWWGEGDEKFFVDGEKFPSTYGTGSEDYFGYAWSNPELFQNAFHNQTISEGNKGHVSVNRWHIADNVPFQTSFEATIEKYYPNDRPTLYACVAYWYQAAGQVDPYPAVALEDRTEYYTPLEYPLDIAGILVLEEPPGGIEAQGMHGFTADKWTNNEHLWWTGEPDAELKIALDVDRDGKYAILTRLTKAPDYGIVDFYLDDEKLAGPIDLYNPDEVVATRELNLGTVELTAGRHVLTVHIVGANRDAIKRYMVGIDYLKVKRSLF